MFEILAKYPLTGSTLTAVASQSYSIGELGLSVTSNMTDVQHVHLCPDNLVEDGRRSSHVGDTDADDKRAQGK
jgi:hypothetical protein